MLHIGDERTEVINPDHLSGHDWTVETATLLWMARNPPLTWNSWQSFYWALRRAGFRDPPAEAPGASASKQGRTMELYLSVSEQQHGPDFKAQAVLALSLIHI